MKTISVVCPVYNEEEVIEQFYGELKNVLLSLEGSYDSRVIFVVDRSQDATLDKLRAVARMDPSVTVLSLSSRFGHQASILAGIDQCDSDAVIMMDSDLQHPPSLIPTMLAEFERRFDIVYTIREDAPDAGLGKRVTSRVFYRILNRLTDIPVNENAADFRLISRRVAELFQTQLRERNLFLRGLVSWIGFRSTGVSFRAQERRAGRSKYSLWRMVRFAVDGIVSSSKSLLIAAIFIGLGIAACGFVGAILTIALYFVKDFPRGWATLAVLLSAFTGIQLTFLGILGAYIGAIFDEVKARPHYIVEESISFDNGEMVK